MVLKTICASLISIAVMMQTGEMVADFENGQIKSNAGTLWQIYTDVAAGGDSEAVVRIVDEGAAGEKAMRIEGSLGSQFAYPFAGTQLYFSEDRTPKDFHQNKGIRFYVRGDGGTYLIQALTASVFDHNNFSKSFSAGETWAKIEIPFSDLKQNPNWGRQVTWTAKDIRGIGFHVFGDPRDFYLEVDQIEVY